jgi:hypothetical protein
MKFRSLVAAGVAASALAVPGAALAATDSTSVTVSGNTASGLTFVTSPTFGDFAGVTLDTTAQSTSADINAFSVQDTRGTLDGWHVNIKASQFANDLDSTVKLPTSSMTIAATPTIAPLAPLSSLISSLTQPTVGNLVGTAIDDGNDHLWVSAPANPTSGGEWDVSAATGGLSLSVPPTTEAGTYSSTVTTTLATGIS